MRCAADVEMWDKMINLNLLVPMKLTHALAPILARSHAGGHIINISSVAGLRPSKYNAAYSASKWGLTGWSKACFEVSPMSLVAQTAHSFLAQASSSLVLKVC